MNNRLLIGAHPIHGMGLFLSRPGVDAIAASAAADFLLATTVKNEQVLMNGVIGVGPHGQATVLFPAVLPSRPMVSFISAPNGGQIVYPWRADQLWEESLVISAQCGISSVIFSNSSSNGLAVFYMVIARSF